MDTPFTLGGEQRVVTVLANYLIQQGYQVTFLLTSSNKNIDYSLYQLDEKAKVVFLEKYNNFFHRLIRKFWKILGQCNRKYGWFQKSKKIIKNSYCNRWDMPEIIEVIKKQKFDAIIGIASTYSTILSILKPKISHTKTIGWQHSTYEAYFEMPGRRFYHQEIILNDLFQNLDVYIVQTKDDKEKIKKHFNYDVINIANPNAFKTDKHSKLTSKKFLAAGRFSFVKSFDKLIRAFYIFSKKNKDWNLYIYGDGPEKRKCEELVKELGLENRVFLPGKTSDMESQYLDATIYLMSSLWEGWGMVVTEAMEYGLPVISFDLPSVREIFEEKNCGYIIEQNHLQDYADAMLSLANDPVKISEMSKQAIEQAEKFSVEKIGEQWIKVLESRVR